MNLFIFIHIFIHWFTDVSLDTSFIFIERSANEVKERQRPDLGTMLLQEIAIIGSKERESVCVEKGWVSLVQNLWCLGFLSFYKKKGRHFPQPNFSDWQAMKSNDRKSWLTHLKMKSGSFSDEAFLLQRIEK